MSKKHGKGAVMVDCPVRACRQKCSRAADLIPHLSLKHAGYVLRTSVNDMLKSIF